MAEHHGGLQAILDNTDLFAGLKPAELEQLAVIAKRQKLAAGECIFRLGDDAVRVYAIEAGQVELKLPLSAEGDKEITVNEKAAGAVFAWSALVPPHKLMLSAYAETDVELVAFDRSELTEFLDQHDSIQIQVLKNLNRVIAGRVAMLEAVLVRNLQRWLEP